MPVQDTEDARKTSEPVADAEEELRKQQAAKQEHQQDETSVQKSGKLLPLYKRLAFYFLPKYRRLRIHF